MNPFRDDLLAGRTTIITGGGSGLGRAMALKVAALGAPVAVLGRRPEPLEETAALIREAGGRAAAVPCDVRDAHAVTHAFDAAEAALGPASALVNNAAGNFLCASEDLTPNGFNAVVKIVLYGSFHCTHELGRRLIGRGDPGAVVSIVTTYAESGSAFVLPSAVAKAGVLAMTRSLAVEWALYGIRLNAVAPGHFPTEGAKARLLPDPALEREVLRRIPSRRHGEDEELTNLVAYLLSDASPFQTGDLLTVDGAEALLSGAQFSAFTHLDRGAAKKLFARLKPSKGEA